jgi:rod shape-determining protein MreD
MRLLRLVGLPLLVFTAIVLQRTGVGQVTIDGVHPDLVMLMVAAIGVWRGREVGAVSGFFAGLVVDTFLTTPFGISALVYTVVGYLAGEIERRDDEPAFALKILTVGLASLAGEGLSAIVLYLLGLPDPMKPHLVVGVVIVGGVNLVLAPLALGLARLVFGPEARAKVVDRR